MRSSNRLRSRVTALSILTGLLFATAPSRAAAPVNDDPAGAIAIPALPYSDTADVSEANGSMDDPFVVGAPTIWYRFTPTEDVDVVLDTSGSSSTMAVAVFLDPPSESTLVAAPLDDPRRAEAALFAGTPYTIMIFALESPGQLSLTVSARPLGQAPVNDLQTGAATLPTLPFSDTRDAALATGAPDDPFIGGELATIWYRFTPSRDMDVVFDVSGSSGFSGVAAFMDPPSPATLVGTPLADPTSVEVALYAGTTYYIMVFAIEPPGELALTAHEREGAQPPVNDTYERAATFPGLPFDDLRDISLATGSLEDPFLMGDLPTVWYRVTPTQDLDVLLDVSASSGFTAVAVFTDPPLEGTLVAPPSETDPRMLEVSLKAFETYAVMVFAIDAPGQLALTASVIDRPDNDAVYAAFPIETLPYAHTDDISNATGLPSDPLVHGAAPTTWYRFTPDAHMVVDFDASASDGVVRLAVFSDPLSDASLIASDSALAPSTLRAELSAGTPYYLMAYTEAAPGTITLAVTRVPPPPHDDIDAALPITSLPVSDQVDARLATADARDPFWDPSARTLWYRVAFDEDITLGLDASASDGPVSLQLFADPPSEASLLAETTGGGTSTLEVDLWGGFTYWIMARAHDGTTALELSATDLTVRGPPVVVTVTPAQAAELPTLLAVSDPTRPLEIALAPGDYALPFTLDVDRTHVTFRALDPTARPRLFGASDEATLFSALGVKELRFIDLELSHAKTAIDATEVDALRVERCGITTSSHAVVLRGGRRVVVRDSTVVAGAGIALWFTEVRGAEVSGNVLEADRADPASPHDCAGLVSSAAMSTAPPFDPGAVLVRDNRVGARCDNGTGIIAEAAGALEVDANAVEASVGIVAVGQDLGRELGLAPSVRVVRDNAIDAIVTGLVASGFYGQMIVRDTRVRLRPDASDPRRPDFAVGIQATQIQGRCDLIDNDVQVLPSSPAQATPTFGIWQLQVGALDQDDPVNDAGLSTLAGNHVSGATYGIVSDHAFEASVVIADNDVHLDLDGRIGISASRFGGDEVLAWMGLPPRELPEPPFAITDNQVRTLPAAAYAVAPTGIEAASFVAAAAPVPLQVAHNHLDGVFGTAINAYGTRVEVRDNRVEGSFAIGIDTLDTPSLEVMSTADEFRMAHAFFGRYGDRLPAPASAVIDNRLRLRHWRDDVTPILTEDGATVIGNQFGFLATRPWSP